MITKEQAIEILKGDFSKVVLSENESHSELFAEAFNMAIEALNGKDTNVPSKWIPCSERLPEEGKSVLISTKTSDRVYVGLYTKRYGFEMREGFICADGFMWLNTATAWMPLPEPFKESEE